MKAKSEAKSKVELKQGNFYATAFSGPRQLRSIARRLRKDLPELKPATSDKLAPIVAQILNETTAEVVKLALKATWEGSLDYALSEIERIAREYREAFKSEERRARRKVARDPRP